MWPQINDTLLAGCFMTFLLVVARYGLSSSWFWYLESNILVKSLDTIDKIVPNDLKPFWSEHLGLIKIKK